MNPKEKALTLKVKHLGKKPDRYKHSLASYLDDHKNDEFKSKRKS